MREMTDLEYGTAPLRDTASLPAVGGTGSSLSCGRLGIQGSELLAIETGARRPLLRPTGRMVACAGMILKS